MKFFLKRFFIHYFQITGLKFFHIPVKHFRNICATEFSVIPKFIRRSVCIRFFHFCNQLLLFYLAFVASHPCTFCNSIQPLSSKQLNSLPKSILLSPALHTNAKP